jgi:long-subunit fatty acid transport protein
MGQIGYTKIREFFDDEFDKEKVKYIFARGIGFKLFHPTWKISPSIGLAYNKQTSKNQPYGLKENNAYLTYSAGIDYQMRIGFQCSIGVNYSPELPSSAKKRVYGNIGFFF